jgi:hypothetical protein
MIYLPPNDFSDRDLSRQSVFLAGSIEMGVAELWQDRAAAAFDEAGMDVFNPRRPDWDSTWTQDITNIHFFRQVKWELDALDAVDCIVMYFDPATKSPISLLELGLHARSGKLSVVCPKGFWRKGNVDIVCDRYNITQYDTLDAMVEAVIAKSLTKRKSVDTKY